MCFTDSMVGIETGSLEGNQYVEYFLRHRKQEIRESSYASGGQPNIKLEMLHPYPLALPPLAEQHEIVRRVEALLARADRIEKRLASATRRVETLTQAILAHGLALQHPPPPWQRAAGSTTNLQRMWKSCSVEMGGEDANDASARRMVPVIGETAYLGDPMGLHVLA